MNERAEYLGHYEILERYVNPDLFAARNSHNDQTVLIKPLPTGAGDTGDAIQKLVNQTRRLTPAHYPELIHILSVEEFGGSSFVVLEFPQGKALLTEMEKGPLPLMAVLDIGSQLADILDVLHCEGYVHTQISPSTIFLNDGSARLLFVDVQEEPSRGMESGIQSDISSLGAVLFQAATGVTIADAKTISAKSIRPELPEAFDVILRFSLAPEQNQRYQSAYDLAHALRRLKVAVTHDMKISAEELQSGLAPPPEQAELHIAAPEKTLAKRNRIVIPLFALAILVLGAAGYFAFLRWNETPSLAVVPFVNESDSKTPTVWSESLVEDLILSTSRIPSLRVISAESIFYYAKAGLRPEELAQKLNANHVLTGTMKNRDGEDVSLDLQFVQAPNGKVIWARNYSFNRYDAGSTLHSITEDIGRSLNLEPPPPIPIFPRDVKKEAMELYWQARASLRKKDLLNLRAGLQLFQRALIVSPGFTQAQDGVAESLFDLSRKDPSSRQLNENAKKTSIVAIQMNRLSPKPHAILGAISLLADQDLSQAEIELGRAIELNPNEPLAHTYRSMVLAITGKTEDAWKHLQLVRRLDPFSLEINTTAASIMVQIRRFAEATELTRTLAEYQPTPEIYIVMGDAYHGMSMPDEAMRAYKLAKDLGAIGAETRTAGVMASSGLQMEAISLLRKLENTAAISPLDLARAYALLSDSKQSILWLEKSYSRNEEGFLFLKTDFAFDRIRSQPAFQKFLQRIGQ